MARQYRDNIREFETTARQWTQEYAQDPTIVYEEKVKRLCEMGFDEPVVRQMLENSAGDEQVALNALLS